jgi:predicted polyphosphate/ATP-dependent NAD kinase
MDTTKTKIIGFLINPIAGMGGKVALKGTDTKEILCEAIKRGATPVSPLRAQKFLQEFSRRTHENCLFLVPPAPMGAQLFQELKQLNFSQLNVILNEPTSAADTRIVVRMFCKLNVELIIFVGGDGTSVDISESIEHDVPVIGIPSGVKTYGEGFVHNPEEAALVVAVYLKNPATRAADVLDLNEDDYRKGKLTLVTKGAFKVPNLPQYFQSTKSSTNADLDEDETLKRIASYLQELIAEEDEETPVIIGPGSSLKYLATALSISRSILGVDIYYKGKLLAKDAQEKEIFSLCFEHPRANPPIVIVTPIGGLGYLFGRGNHQFSARILSKIPKDNIWVVATRRKLSTLQGGVLRVDTEDSQINASLAGYIRVIVDRAEYQMVKMVNIAY